MVAGCGPRPTVALPPNAIPLYTVMSGLNIETFRASTMIVNSLRHYLPETVLDHESPIRGCFLKFLALRQMGPGVHASR